MNIKTDTLTHEREWLLTEKYGGVKSPAYERAVLRLLGGEPLAYLIGHVPFLESTIYLDSRPLIPRPETEYWTIHAIEHIRSSLHERKGPLCVLDLCAGSGCIGTAVLQTIPHVLLDFAEIDTEHHETIAKNLRVNTIDTTRASIHGGSLFDEIPKKKTRYDFILTNPPYIDPTRIGRVEKNVIEHEPAGALFGGVDGMEYIARILTETPRYLGKGGVLYLEHEPEQKKLIHDLARLLAYDSCDTYTDQWHLDRYTCLTHT